MIFPILILQYYHNETQFSAYFASVGASQQQQDGGAVEKKVTLEDQIVQTNPVCCHLCEKY